MATTNSGAKSVNEDTTKEQPGVATDKKSKPTATSSKKGETTDAITSGESGEEAEESAGPQQKQQQKLSLSKQKKPKKQSAEIFRTTNSDNWDLDLIPQWLIDKIYAEMLLDSDGEVTEDTVLEEEESDEEEEDLSQIQAKTKFSMPNIPGAIPKKTLKFMSRKSLKALIHKTRTDICYMKCETTVLRKAMDKMEKRDREIDNYIPFQYELPWEVRTQEKKQLCDSSSHDSDSDAAIIPIKPLDMVNFSTDKVFETMSEKTQLTVRNWVENLGDIAPDNFDVMRYKYGKLVKYGKEHRRRKHKKVSNTTQDSSLQDPRKVLQAAIKDQRNAKIILLEESKVEPQGDADYPGFKPSKAKKLAIEDKLKYAIQQEEQMRDEFVDAETELMIAKYKLQVHVDMNVDSVRLLSRITKGLRKMVAISVHPITGKLMAEKVVGYRRYMKKAILAEETKTTLTTIHLNKQLSKIKLHLRLKTNAVEKVGFIDFEEIRITNSRLSDLVAVKNQDINDCKLIETNVCKALKEAQDIMFSVSRKHNKTTEEINRRKSLVISFYNDFLHYQKKLQDVIQRSNFLKQMHTSTAPDTLEYIRLKSDEYKLIDNVVSLKQKISHLEDNLVAAREDLVKTEKKLPLGAGKEAGDWLEDIKTVVRERGLLDFLDDEDLIKGRELINYRQKNLGISGIPKSKTGRESLGKQPRMAQLLLGKPKRKPRKKRQLNKPASYERASI